MCVFTPVIFGIFDFLFGARMTRAAVRFCSNCNLDGTVFVCLVYCPGSKGFTYDSGSGTCLKLMAELVFQPEANARCHDLDQQAHLVGIQNHEKQAAVRGFIEGEMNITSYLRRFA